jgi:hypothetical protein
MQRAPAVCCWLSVAVVMQIVSRAEPRSLSGCLQLNHFFIACCGDGSIGLRGCVLCDALRDAMGWPETVQWFWQKCKIWWYSICAAHQQYFQHPVGRQCRSCGSVLRLLLPLSGGGCMSFLFQSTAAAV